MTLKNTTLENLMWLLDAAKDADMSDAEISIFLGEELLEFQKEPRLKKYIFFRFQDIKIVANHKYVIKAFASNIDEFKIKKIILQVNEVDSKKPSIIYYSTPTEVKAIIKTLHVLLKIFEKMHGLTGLSDEHYEARMAEIEQENKKTKKTKKNK